MQANSRPLKIYLDTCCLSRLFDPLTQARVRQEAEAVNRILTYCFSGHWYWTASDVLFHEVNRTTDLEERAQIKTWLTFAHQTVHIGADEISRGIELEALGFKERDALHLACAESGEVNFFLTTDDRLLRRAKRYPNRLHIHVENPYTWLRETENGHLRDDRS